MADFYGELIEVKGIIDRFEEEYALLELDSREMIEISRNLVPDNAKVGDVLVLQGDRYVIDQVSTKKRQEYIKNLNGSIWD